MSLPPKSGFVTTIPQELGMHKQRKEPARFYASSFLVYMFTDRALFDTLSQGKDRQRE